ncbi:MAG: Crp/Fnr family transcriptional regulator [Candidatus Acidiferrales bacterium]
MTTQLDPRNNRLLAGLPAADYEKILPELEPYPLPLGETLHGSGRGMHHVYCPLDAIISMIYVMENGDSAEVGVIGYEGMAGVSLFMGGETTPNDAVVQHPGHSWRMSADTVTREFHRGGAFQLALLRYIQAYMTQMSQTAVCNRHHSVDKQLCRWLLLSIDRLPSNRVHMTHELIANMLGVRREGVTRALGQLAEAGLVNNDRGRITVLDRPGLEARVCECYDVVQKAYERLLPPASPSPTSPSTEQQKREPVAIQ